MSGTLLERCERALWDAFMEESAIKMGKEFMSFDEFRASQDRGNETAQHYAATIRREVLAVAKVLLSERANQSNEGLEGARSLRDTLRNANQLVRAQECFDAISAARLAALEAPHAPRP